MQIKNKYLLDKKYKVSVKNVKERLSFIIDYLKILKVNNIIKVG